MNRHGMIPFPALRAAGDDAKVGRSTSEEVAPDASP